MRAPALVAAEVAHHTRVFWRSPLAAFFTVAFPMMFLVVLNLLNAGEVVESLGGVSFPQFFTPSMAVFAMVTAGYTNVAITTALDRDEGILKRIIGTPLPPWVFIAGRVGAAAITGLASVVLMLAVGVLAFGVEVLEERLAVAAVVLAVGAAAFSALGLAVAAVARSGQAAPALANATILPLAFVSGIFFPIDRAPGWLQTLTDVLPLRPFARAFGEQWNPVVPPRFPWPEVLVVLAWGAAGALVAARSFTWEPRGPGRRRAVES